MNTFTLIWPRAKGVILLGLAVFALVMLVLIEPAFMPPFAFDNVSAGIWAFFAGALIVLMLGFKLTFFSRVIIRCTEEGVFIPQHGCLIPWRNVVSVARSRMKVAATQPMKPGSVGEARHADAIRITFDNSVSLSTRFQYNDFRAEQPNVYLFSAAMSRLSVEEIESLLKKFKDNSK